MPINRLACLDSNAVLLLRYAGLALSVLPFVAVVTLIASLLGEYEQEACRKYIQRSIVYVIELSRFVMIVADKADKLKWHVFPPFVHIDGSESSCHLFIGCLRNNTKSR